MRPPIDGSVTVVTGASSGIGRELARLFASRARCLVLVARREERLRALATQLSAAHPGLKVVVAPCDVGSPDAISSMLETVTAEAGQVDILVNCAGAGEMGPFHTADWERLERVLQANVLGLTYLTHRVVADMTRRRRGGVLNVSSGFGLEFMPGVATYGASKHYVTALSEALRLEVRGLGVVVSQVCPGPVATEFEDIAARPGRGTSPAIIRQSAERCARAAFKGFRRGRALIVPSLSLRLVLWLGAVSPRWLKRLAYRPVAWWVVGGGASS